MKHRFTAIAGLILLAACGETPTEPTTPFDVAPAFAVVPPPSVINGGFESGYTGWTFGDVDVVGTITWAPSEGSYSLDLNGFTPGYITQDFTTVPGATYTVLFDLAGNPGFPQNVKKLAVAAADDFATYEFDTTGRSGTDMGWRAESFTFTATDAITTLIFASGHIAATHPDRAQGPALDNIRIAANNPSTKDDCKKGGWEGYGFRNQGLCIQYVNTGKDSR